MRVFIYKKIYDDGSEGIASDVRFDPEDTWGCKKVELLEELTYEEFQKRYITDYRLIKDSDGQTYFSDKTAEYYKTFGNVEIEDIEN